MAHRSALHLPLRPQPDTRRRRVSGLCAVVWCALCLTVAACSPPPPPVTASVMALPEGGAVRAIVRGDAGVTLMGMTARGLATHDGARWYVHPVTLRLGREEQTIALRSLDTQTAAARRLTTHAGRLWWLTTHTMTQAPVLFSSDDGGTTWARVALPGRLQRPLNLSGVPDRLALSRAPISSVTSPRLVSGAGGLYVIGERAIWVTGARGESPKWRALALRGVELRASTDRAVWLPPLLHTYLPAHPRRPFELLTVLSDQLRVYRRATGQEQWSLVHTLPTRDVQIELEPSGDAFYFLTATRLYRVSDQGERWEMERTVALGDDARYTALALVPGEASRPPTLVLGTGAGAIWTRPARGAGAWRQTREPDPDGRGITALVWEPTQQRLWASTEGLGVLRSPDHGATWQDGNEGLQATRPRALLTRGDRLMLGTLAGLFERRGDAWVRRTTRATTALAARSDAIMLGTQGGGLFRLREEELRQLAQLPPDASPDVALQLDAQAGVFEEMPTALVQLDVHDARGRWIAWSASRGMLRTEDSGASWRHTRWADALRDALGEVHVTTLARRSGETWLTTSATTEKPPQLWREGVEAGAGNARWRTVSVPASPDETRPPRVYTDARGALWLLQAGAVLRSSDRGETWAPFAGPWDAGAVVALHTHRDGKTDLLTLVVRTEQGHELHQVRAPHELEPTRTRFPIQWPAQLATRSPQVLELRALGARMVLRTPDQLLLLSVPQQQGALTSNLGLIIATLIVTAFCAVAFAILWRSS